MRHRRIAAAGAVLVAVGVVTVPAWSATAATAGAPMVAVSPGLAWPHRPVTVSGSGFGAGPVVLRLDGAMLSRVPATAGRFTARVVVPGTETPGAHRLTAVAGTRSAAATLQTRVQWTQLGLYAAHRGANWYEHRLSPATVGQTVPLYQGSSSYSPHAGGVVLAQGLLVYGMNYGAMAINATTGKVAWVYDNGLDAYDSGIAYDPASGTTYLTNNTPYLDALDTATGTPRGLAMDLGVNSVASTGLTLAHGLLYLTGGTASGVFSLIAVDPVTKTVRWRTPKDYATTTPVLYNGVLYLVGHNLSAFNADTGQALWSVPLSADGQALGAQPAADAGGVIFGVDDGSTRSYDAATGRLLWTTGPIGSDADIGRAVTIGGGLAFVDYGSATFALNETTGAVVWQKPGGGAGSTYANGLLISHIIDPAATQLALSAVVAATGTLLTTFPVNSGPGTPPIVADGTIYIPDHGLDAFTLPAGAGGAPTK